MVCSHCSHSWNVWHGKQPDPLNYRKQAQRKHLTEDQVRLVLTERSLTQAELAKRIGRSRSTVQRIQSGKLHADIAVDLPRFNRKTELSCLSCLHHQGGRCKMDVPDFLTEGKSFALDCEFFSAT